MEIHGAAIARWALDTVIEQTRASALTDGCIHSRSDAESHIAVQLGVLLDAVQRHAPRRVINATGVLIHTGLGRAPLAEAARTAVLEATGACQLEVEPETGERRYRGYQVVELLRALTGAEDSLIVNNNSGATLLVLQALCQRREVLISRGQLVEIGGSFRLPEIFSTAGVTLREVGTTNRTHPEDYARAVSDSTAAILRVHASNYRMVGFVSEPSTSELVKLAERHSLLMIDDIGSGQLFPTPQLKPFGEPDFRSSLASGAHLVLGSADKLLGGPQAGVILGRSDLIAVLKAHPLARCLRIDKLTLAALHATLLIHANPNAPDKLPLFGMLSASVDELHQRAASIAAQLGGLTGFTAEIVDSTAEVGGGSCAGHSIPSKAIRLNCPSLSAEQIGRQLRCGAPAVWGRLSGDCVLLDMRSVQPADDLDLARAIRSGRE